MLSILTATQIQLQKINLNTKMLKDINAHISLVDKQLFRLGSTACKGSTFSFIG